MSLFKEVLPDKCAKCMLVKRKYREVQKLTPRQQIQRFAGNGEILVLTEEPYGDEDLDMLSWYLESQGITDYQIASALQCRFSNPIWPNPQYKIYSNCNFLDTDDFDCKVIVTVGRAMMAITQGDALIWRDFNEQQFNQSYFWTSFQSKNKLPIFPLYPFDEWINKDCFEAGFAKEQFRLAKEFIANPEQLDMSYTLVEVQDPQAFFDEFQDAPEVAADIETTGLQQFVKDFQVISTQFCFDGKTSYFLDFKKVDKQRLSRWFANKRQIYANGKFDCKGYHVSGVENAKVDEDMVLAYHMLSTEKTKTGLKSLAWLVGFGNYEKELEDYKAKHTIKNYLQIPHEYFFKYSALDPLVLHRLYVLSKRLWQRQPQQEKIYREVVIPVIEVFKDMEIEGLRVDQDKLVEVSEILQKELRELEEKIQEVFGERFNVNSTEDLAKLFQRRGWPAIDVSDKKSYSLSDGTRQSFYKVGEEQLLKYKLMGYSQVDLILKHREISKMLSTYLSKQHDDVLFNTTKEGIGVLVQDDGRIHDTFMPGMADSLRSRARILQTIPKQGKLAKPVRSIYVPPPGWEFAEVDYSGLQMRIAAIYSGDPLMTDVFVNQGGDAHSITARNVFARKLTVDEFLKQKKVSPYKEYRTRSKPINFAYLFGSGAYTLYSTIENEWSKEDLLLYKRSNPEMPILKNKEKKDDLVLSICTDIRNKFFEGYAGLQPWFDSQEKTAKKQGYIDSWHGVRRHLPEYRWEGYDSNSKDLASLKNISVNSPVQAFEAVLAYTAMVAIHKQLKSRKLQAKFVAMIHDAFVFVNPPEERQELTQIFKSCMEIYDFSVPILVEEEFTPIWGFAA